MSASINSLMVREGPGLFYTQAFRNVLEDHLEYLRNHQNTEALPIEDHPSHKYEGDFYGLLQHYRIKAEHRWLVMRLSGLTSPTDYHGQVTQAVIPSETEVNKIVQLYRASEKG